MLYWKTPTFAGHFDNHSRTPVKIAFKGMSSRNHSRNSRKLVLKGMNNRNRSRTPRKFDFKGMNKIIISKLDKIRIKGNE